MELSINLKIPTDPKRRKPEDEYQEMLDQANGSEPSCTARYNKTAT